MLFGPFIGGFVLWILLIWLFRDHDLHFFTIVLWSVGAYVVGIVGQIAFEMLMESTGERFPSSTFEYGASEIVNMIFTMAVIYFLIWRQYGIVPLDKGIALFIGYMAVRIVILIVIFSGGDTPIEPMPWDNPPDSLGNH
jgi:hypothetical protein